MIKPLNSVAVRFKQLPPITQDWCAILFFLVLALVINWKPICYGILFEAHDVWSHLFWLEHFYRELEEGIFYPRWLAAGNYGLGSPIFVFYPPLVYYIGAALRFIFHLSNAEQEITALFSAAIFFSAVAFYAYGKTIWGRAPAFAAACFYTTTTYLTYDVYVRAALSETWSFVWMPLIFWSTERAVKNAKYLPVLTLFFSLLFLTSIPLTALTLILWLPFVFVYCRSNSSEKLPLVLGKIAQLCSCILLALAMAAFYLLPAIAQRRLINVDEVFVAISLTTLGGSYFAKMGALEPVALSTFASGLILGFIALGAWRKSIEQRAVTIWVGALFFEFFLISPLSAPLWDMTGPLRYIQFAWRILGPASMTSAILFGYALCAVLRLSEDRRLIRYLCLVALVQLILCNGCGCYLLSKFRSGINKIEPQMMLEQNDPHIYTLRSTVLPDLLRHGVWYPEIPISIPMITATHRPPQEPHAAQPPVAMIESNAVTKINRWGSYDREFSAHCPAFTPVKIRTFFYPAWKLYVDGATAPLRQGDDGLMQFDLGKGDHRVSLQYESTDDVKIGLATSFLALILFGFWSFKTFWLAAAASENKT